MPIGPEHHPPLGIPGSERSFFTRVLLLIGSALGAVLGSVQAVAAPFVEALRQVAFTNNPDVPLSPAEAATGAVKNAVPGGDWAGEARLSGTSPERFAALVALTGNPPGPETLLTMLNRGLIDPATLAHGLRQGYLKDEWIDTYNALRYSLLSPGEVVQAAVQGHLDDGQARDYWQNAGMLPALYDIAYNTAGNPPGPGETLTMLNRGIFTAAEATQALKESRLKDKYIPQFLQLARRRIPMRTLNTLLKAGAISQAVALQDLLDLGFNDADAEALIKTATTATAAKLHDLTVAEITQLYETHHLSAEQATQHLATLGYAPEVAGELLNLGDVRAQLALQRQVITALRTRFVGHRITEAVTRADLAAAAVPSDQIDALIRLWTIEQTASPRELTEAQLRAAANSNVITVADYTARLVGMGYTEADAGILTATHFPPTTGA